MNISQAEYRNWVHSQVANKIFYGLTAIGIGAFALLAGAIITANNWILKDAQEDIENNIINAIEPTISKEILLKLVEQEDLVNAAKGKIKDEVDTEINLKIETSIEGIFDSNKFRSEATANLLDFLKESGGPQDIILEEALERAIDHEESDSVRAFALQLYSLLHAGKRTSPQHEVKPMREMFTQILENPNQPAPFPTKVLSAILEHYPLGKYDNAAGDSECANRIEQCKAWDKKTVEAVLSVFTATGDPSTTTELPYDRFFSRVSPPLADTVLQWIEENSSRPEAHRILVALMGTKKETLISTVLPKLPDFASNRVNLNLRRSALEALARLDPQMNLKRDLRAELISKIWNSASVEELDEAFSEGVVGELIQVMRNQSGNAAPINALSAWVGESHAWVGESHEGVHTFRSFRGADLSNLIRLSVVGLLRTGAHENIPTEGSNDWKYVLWPVVTINDKDSFIRAYTAWILRIAVDMAQGYNVQWAADKLLEEPPTQYRTDVRARFAVEFAVSVCTEKQFSDFTTWYLAYWLTSESGASLFDLTSALIRRDRRSSVPYNWLKTVLTAISETGVRDHMIDALHGEHLGSDYNGRVQRMQNTLARAVDDASRNDNEADVSRILFSELLKRMEDDREYWTVVAATELLGLFSPNNRSLDDNTMMDNKELESIKNLMPWVGTEIPAEKHLTPIPGTHDLEVVTENESRKEGGDWYRIQSNERIMVRINDIPKDTEIVIMDKNRTTTFERNSNRLNERSFEHGLPPGDYAFAFRVVEIRSQDSNVKLSLRLDPAPHRLSITTSSDPIETSKSVEYLFDSGKQTGETWLAVSLENNSILEVETESTDTGPQLRVSPYIIVGLMKHLEPEEYFQFLRFAVSIDPSIDRHLREMELIWEDETNRILASLPELYGYGLMSRDNYSLRGFPLGESLAQVIFNAIVLTEAHQDAVGWHLEFGENEESRLANLIADYDAELGMVMDSVFSGRGLDTHLRLLRDKTGELLALDDDGGRGVNARLVYQSEQKERLLLHVSRCCTTPFQPDDKFLLRIDINQNVESNNESTSTSAQ